MFNAVYHEPVGILAMLKLEQITIMAEYLLRRC